MAALIIESTNSKNLKLIAELAKQLGSKLKSISHSSLIDFEDKEELPDFVLKGIERGLEDVKAGRVKSFEEVKEMMAKR